MGPGVARAYLPPPYGGSITVPLPDGPVTLDPSRASRASELQVVSLLYDTLFRLSAKGVPRPHLVDPEVQVSADGKTWRMRLRPGVRLHHGAPLTAKQVAASLGRVLQGKNGYLLAAMTSVRSEGKDLLVLKLRRKTPELGILLSAPACAVAVHKGGALYGTGPFRLHSRDKSVIVLKANSHYFAGRPYLDQIRFKNFNRASAEVASFQLGALQFSLHGVRVYGGRPRHAYSSVAFASSSTIFLGLGRNKAFLADVQFRQALLQAVDRRRLARLVGTAQAAEAHGPVLRRLLRKPPRAVAFNRAAAYRLLRKAAQRHAGMKDLLQPTGKLRLSLMIDGSRSEDRVLAGQVVADLDRVGITAGIDVQPADQYQARLESGRYDLVLGRQAIQAPRTSAALAGALMAAGVPDRARRCLAQSRWVARESAWFVKQLPYLPLIHAAHRLHHDARLGGVKPTAIGLISFGDIYWQRGSP